METESYNESDYISDDYAHPSPDLFYSVTRTPGKGVPESAFRCIECGCKCPLFQCTEQNNCSCLKYGANYRTSDDGLLLVKEKFENVPVFECNSQCSCIDGVKNMEASKRPSGTSCPNRNVQFGPIEGLEVFEAGPKGWGLKTKKKIPSGRFICEYAGEVISLEEAKKRQKANRGMNYVFVLREFTGNSLSGVTCVDPTHVGNIGRYINHSCEPNAAIVPVRVNDVIPWLCVFAVRDIQENEEICYDYSGLSGSNEAEDDASPERKPCFCGSLHYMELLPRGRNFRLVTKEELPDILNVLEKYLPDSLKFHQTIKTYLNDCVWEFHFYVTQNWPNDPICLHFPGMTSSPNGLLYESFSVFCPTSNLELLSLVENEDVLLDWSKPIYLNFTHTSITDRLETFYKTIGTVEKVEGDVYMCVEPKEDAPSENIQEGFEIRQLKIEDVGTIHELYPANDMEAVSVFEKLILRLPAYGVFCSGVLAAWMVQSYYGAMFSMQTRPEFRRRGYGILLAKKLMNLVLERGYIPYVVIRPENDASKSLYSKLGFRKIYQTARVVFKPYDSQGKAESESKSQPEL